jgi:ATP-dependent Clp protease protease subunit
MAVPKGMARKLLLSKDVDNESMESIIKSIIEINESDRSFEEDYGVKYELKPIVLFINSCGGSVYDGLALVDIMLNSKTPVHTVSIGSSMSMGLWILLAGSKRFIGKNTTLMYHEVASWSYDKLEGIKDDIVMLQNLQDMYDDIVLKNTKTTNDKLEYYKTRKKDWYIQSKDAIDLGFGELWQ